MSEREDKGAQNLELTLEQLEERRLVELIEITVQIQEIIYNYITRGRVGVIAATALLYGYNMYS